MIKAKKKSTGSLWFLSMDVDTLNSPPTVNGGKVVVASVLNEGSGAMTLQEIDGESVASVTLDQRGTFSFEFSVTEEKMVNLWINGIGMRDVDLEITGGNLAQTYSSNKTGTTGESISLKLTPGTYTVSVKDVTNYRGSMATGDFPIELHYSMEQFSSSEIVGRISIADRVGVMPVSMRVAEFDGAGRRLETPEHNLDSSKPVWVVVHGRNDSEKGNNIEYLSRSLTEQGYQVVTVDWEDAAQDHGLALGALDNADWTPAVGKWVADQLMNAGFSGDKVLMSVHSHGTFIGYEVGRQFKEGPNGNGFGIQAIVALDTPVDPLPNSYPVHDVVFNDVSRVSWAFRSSSFGSEARSNTASVNFDIVAPSEEYENTPLMPPINKALIDASQAYFGEHGYAVSYFANLVKGNGNTSLDVLRIEDLVKGKTPAIPIDANGVEGVLPITLREANGSQGTYWQAVPTSLIQESE